MYDKEHLEDLRAALKDTLFGFQIYHFEEIGSTSDFAHTIASQEATDGILVIADRQTHGRGRLGKEWVSPNGGLWYSLILIPPLRSDQVESITLVMALPIVRAINAMIGEGVSLKWPNDLYFNGKKCGGILTELFTAYPPTIIKYIIMGIGINVNIDKTLLPDGAISLKTNVGAYDYTPLLVTILREMDHVYRMFREDGSLKPFIDEINAVSFLNGKLVKVEFPHRYFFGIAETIDERGRLMVRMDDGSIESINAGEVSLPLG